MVFWVRLSIVQGKIFLEQTVRLLGEAKDLAEYSAREVTFDASRGVTGKLAAAFNTSGDLFAEVNNLLQRPNWILTNVLVALP